MDVATMQQFLAAMDATVTGHGPDSRQPAAAPEVAWTGEGALPSVFAVTDLAAASVAAAGGATARLMAALGPAGPPPVAVDGRLASWWFATTVQPQGWQPADVWDDVAGIYATTDGHVRLHTNAAHHKAAALSVLGCEATRDAVTVAASGWTADELEMAVVEAGGAAAALRHYNDWLTHPQGAAVGAEPLIHWDEGSMAPDGASAGSGHGEATVERPLAGVRVLDLTRVLAGPVATRYLAGLGADVLRLDPPWWTEPAAEVEVTLGKRCARLDLRKPEARDRLRSLLSEADILVHGYRSDALERLGLGADVRAEIRPGLVDVSLDAYGWTGPWRHRRGFDSLVQLSTGIAGAPQALGLVEGPKPLPVQALDHATGYLMAAAAIEGWRRRLTSGRGARARTSLARTARLLTDGPRTELGSRLAPPTDADYLPRIEDTSWGPIRRLRPPLTIGETALRWDRPATSLGTEPTPAW